MCILLKFVIVIAFIFTLVSTYSANSFFLNCKYSWFGGYHSLSVSYPWIYIFCFQIFTIANSVSISILAHVLFHIFKNFFRLHLGQLWALFMLSAIAKYSLQWFYQFAVLSGVRESPYCLGASSTLSDTLKLAHLINIKQYIVD